jgi:hypothetical protein
MMAITFEDAAIAWAKMLMRAEQAEAKVKELEAEIEKLRIAVK